MSDGALVAIGAIITALLGGGGIGAVLASLHKNRQERQKQAVDEQAAIIDRQERQIGRLDLQIAEQNRVIALLQDEHADCQVNVAELYGYLVLFRDVIVRQTQVLKSLGHDCGPIPDLPPRPARREGQAAPQFQARTSIHAAGILRGVDARLSAPGGSPQGGAPEGGGA